MSPILVYIFINQLVEKAGIGIAIKEKDVKVGV